MTSGTWRAGAAAAAIGAAAYFAASRRPAAPPARVGDPAPAVRLTDVAGQAATLAQYRGKVVLLDFWATWCDTCVGELPELKALHERYRSGGLEILAASVDAQGRKVLLPFIAEHGIPWRVLVADENAARAFRVSGLPAKFLIDRTGLIARRYEGPVDPPVLEKDIRTLLEGGHS